MKITDIEVLTFRTTAIHRRDRWGFLLWNPDFIEQPEPYLEAICDPMHEDRNVILPQEPGLGMEFDWDYLNYNLVKGWVIGDASLAGSPAPGLCHRYDNGVAPGWAPTATDGCA